MSEKRMLIVSAEVARKIDENRDDMSRSEFIDFLIDHQLEEYTKGPGYVTREEFTELEQGMKELLRSFLEFFVSYGLELGKTSGKGNFDELNQKLQALGRKG